ncbi:uncharacterized protein LOC134308810 isoform X2 [Trichomycterus rosablanca]|uniref:uncharacterized protein LOC134308810 isoform X2 n=1 Tax=Trichomycterus rosablanca TaxID=2290929 RepID=UPI002F3580B2
MTDAHLDRQNRDSKRVRRSALGPFPRSVWIHSDTPEDQLDQVCFRIWRRSVLAQGSIWPHLAENAHRFMDDPIMQDCIITSKQKNLADETSTPVDENQQGVDEINLMVQKEIQHILQQHGGIVSSTTITCSDGKNPKSSHDIMDIKEAHLKSIEKFLKDALITKEQSKMKDASQVSPLDNSSPLSSTSLPREDNPAKRALIKEDFSSNIHPLASINQAFDDLMGSEAQRSKRWSNCQRANPAAFTEAVIIEEIQATRSSKALNELCSKLLGPNLESDTVETFTKDSVFDGRHINKHGHSKMPVFAESTLGGGVRPQGTGADGACVTHKTAGADTESVRKAAGSPKYAKSHLFQEHVTVVGRKTRGSDGDKGVQAGHMARVQTHAGQHKKVESGMSSRCFPEKLAAPDLRAYALVIGMPASSYPRPVLPPPGFNVPQLSPRSVAMVSLWLSCGVTPPLCIPVSFVTPVLPILPFFTHKDAHRRPLP